MKKQKEIIKRMNNINTFMAHENEVCLGGTDEYGNQFTVWWDSYDFLDWLEENNIKEIQKKLIKYIEKK
jgi:hypothetical protein